MSEFALRMLRPHASNIRQGFHAVEDHLHAFTPHAPLGNYGPCTSGPLNGLTFAVKDLFDVAGLLTGAGNPEWAKGREPAKADAHVVACLRSAGARFVGKTITDEFAWSLGGENAHFGAPLNPVAPGRVTGGSSSGSASAVAGHLADFALGTDTGGSIRLPASYTGLWGFRPSHGALPTQDVVPLAPSYDTVGWLARDADMLARVGSALLTDDPTPIAFSRILIAQDLFDRVHDRHANQLRARACQIAKTLELPTESVTLAPDGIDRWREAFRVCQAAEAWECHGKWVSAHRSSLGADIADRFKMASALTADEIAQSRALRSDIRFRLLDLLVDGTLILVPGAPAPAPLRGRTSPELAAVRAAAIDILCPASHSGVPQLALPAIRADSGPIGLGLLAARGTDHQLLSLGCRIEAASRTGYVVDGGSAAHL
jgi:amidase